MRTLKVVLSMALTASSSLAQDSHQLRICNGKAKTQTEMNACAKDEAARVDAELNDIYRTLLTKTSSEPEAVAKIKAAERAWIAYRDAYLDAMYPAENKQAEYGSVYPMEVDLLRAQLTRQHVAAVSQLLRQHSSQVR
jgi:uncharacterized protein YecT (DUF1311 family)